MNRFRQYIHDHGDARCAAIWGVKERTVADWRRGQHLPHTRTALRLVEISGSAFTVADIYSAPSRAANDTSTNRASV